ncbi:hypothetical protein [Cytobacillus gottheilii]|uniref:hypothetical protein n=1 Tax=Cytobacillus gottheilii TaxID=859144 RepID=UPI003464C5C4
MVSRPLEINTSASIRNRATIEGLLELGHQVDLVTTHFDINHSNFDNSIVNRNLSVNYLKLHGIQSIAKFGRKYKYLQPLKNVLYKVMTKFEVYDNLKGIVDYATRLDITDDTYDLVISTSDPKSSHLFIYRLFENGLIKNTPWIQIWGDPFLSDITRNNMLLNSKIKKEEDKLLANANKVVYVSNLTLNEQKKIYPHYANKMISEPIPYLEKLFYPNNNTQNGVLTFLYCGDYDSGIRDIMPLYKAIKKTKHKLIICGSSNIKLEDTERITILPRVSFEKTKEFEKDCDILVHLSNLRGTQIPGKIFQYSGTNKPILFILDGDLNAIKSNFEPYNRYMFCENSEESICWGIERLINNNHTLKFEPVDSFTPKKVAKGLLENSYE